MFNQKSRVEKKTDCKIFKVQNLRENFDLIRCPRTMHIPLTPTPFVILQYMKLYNLLKLVLNTHLYSN